MSSSMCMSSLTTTLPSSAELLQLLQEQAALQLLQEEAAVQLLMSVRSSVFLVSCCTVRGRSTCFGVSTRPPCMHYRYNRSCAKERTCWRVVRLRTNNFLPSADTSCWVLSALSTIHASTLYPEEGTRSISTPSLTRLSPTLEATTFDLVLLAAPDHAEEVKLRHSKGPGLQLCAMVLDLAMTHFLLEHDHLTWSGQSQGRLCSSRSTQAPLPFVFVGRWRALHLRIFLPNAYAQL